LKAGIITFVFLFSIAFCYSQESQGISNSNYVPTTSVWLNPASIADTRTWIDINIAGLSFFALNNHEVIRKSNFVSGNYQNEEDLEYKGLKYASMDLAIEGPGITYAKGINTYGVAFRNRTQLDFRGIPDHLSHYLHDRFVNSELNEFYEDQLLTIRDMDLNVLQWSEVNFSLGHILMTNNKNQMNAGVTLKTIWAANHFGLKVDYTEYDIDNPSELEITNFKGEYGVGPSSRGYNGLGFDFGFTYKKLFRSTRLHKPHTLRNRCKIAHYRYKVGLSLLDVGSAKFKNKAVRASLNDVSGDLSEVNSVAPGDFGEITPILDGVFDNDLSKVFKEDKYNVGLPTALAFQFDYFFKHNIFLAFNLNQAFGKSAGFGTKRLSSLSLIPRYEKERFEFSFPVTLVNYQEPQIGFAIRAKYVIIGMEKIESLFLNKDVYGFDFYFNLKLPIYRLKSCRSGNRRVAAIPCWKY
jgi:hypothetical protein